MKRVARFVAWLMLAGLVLGVAGVIACGAWTLPLQHAVINIDGDQFTLAHLQGLDWLVAAAAVLLATVIVVLVVPIAVLVPLLIAACAIFVALAAVLGVAALLLSPLLLIGWVVWRLVRGGGRRAATVAG